ncbi:MAG: patatin-like phospholipase family protein [Polyangiales bacterium]
MRSDKAPVPRSVALVLSGGGARGAYEVGVMSYLYDEMVRRRGGRLPPFDIVCGTSVGAINGCHLAAHMADPASGVRRLVDLWSSIRFEQVMRFDVRQFAKLPRVLLGGGEASGIFDVRPMVDLITREISWKMVARALRRGFLRALCVSATEVSTGRTTLFLDAPPEVPEPTGLGARIVVRREIVGPQHALASAAIPLIFPPVRVGRGLYCDGGLRQNTPIAPAIRLGAEKVLVVGLTREIRGSGADGADGKKLAAPSAAFLLGKVLNAFLLDHVASDVELLVRINQILADVEAVGGPGIIDRLSQHAAARGAEVYRKVDVEVVQPSQDLGRMAGQYVRSGRFAGSMVARQLMRVLDSGGGDESDLASYLLFDGGFAKRLIELGRADAEAMRDRLMNFFEA